MMAQLAALGVPMTLSTLYRDRPCTQIKSGNNGAAPHGRAQLLSLSPPRLRPTEQGIEHIQRTLAAPPVTVEKVVEKFVEVTPATQATAMPQPSAALQSTPIQQPLITPTATAERVLAESMQTMQRFLVLEREQEENETRLLSQYLQAQSAMMSRFLSPVASASDAATCADSQNGAQTRHNALSSNELEVAPTTTNEIPAPYPLLGEIRHLVPGQELDSHLVLDLDEHLFLADHSLVRAPHHLKAAEELLPTLPMTGSIEIMAEAAAALVPQLKVIACHDIEARRWIAMHGQRQLPLNIKARRVAPSEVDVELRVGTEKTPSFCGSVTLGETLPPPPAPMQLVYDKPCPHTPEQLYREGRLFHGPKFQILKRFHGLSNNSIAADVEVRDQRAMFASPLQRPLIIDPILMDGVGQAVGYRAQLDGSTLFPVRLARVSLHGERPAVGAVLHAEMAYRRVDDRRVEGDIDVYDEHGHIWMHIDAWQIWRLLMPPDFQAVTWQPEERCLAMPWPLDDSRVTACRVHSKLLGEANLDWLARLYLGGAEWDTYQANPRYDWLLGRIAAKDAVRSRIKQMSGGSLHPLEIRIANLSSGAPVLEAPGGYRWALSISHIKDEAIAAVADAPGVGVDVVRVTPRSPKFMQLAFDSAEKALLAQSRDELSWTHRAWCAKEAAAKMHGVGLEAMPQFRLRRIIAATGVVEIERTVDSSRHQIRTWAENGRTVAVSVLDSPC
jgi:phosphopantetheinyl transferase (holo-ACP synthase)